MYEEWEEPILPEDVDAERMFIATVVPDPGMLYDYSLETPPEWFHAPQHQIVWRAAVSLSKEGIEASPAAIRDRAGRDAHKVGGFPGIVEILMGETVERPESLLAVIRRKWEARETLKALDKASKAILADGQVGSSVDQLRGLLEGFAPRSTPIKHYSDLFQTMEDGYGTLPIDRASNLPVFGLHGLDYSLGALPGTLGVIAAKTSAGKSSLAYQICVHSALRGRNVLLVSLEADREEVAAALAANISQKNRGKLLRTGEEGIDIPGVVKAHIMGYHAGSGATWDTLEKAIRIEHGKSPFHVVIIDYFTLLEPPSYKGNRNMASLYGEISKAGKRLAQQLNCSVIFLSQFNRGVEDGQEPFLENLRETGQLEQDADWVVLLWAKPQDEPGGFRFVNCKIAKNRKGKRGEKFRTKLFPAESRFIDSDVEA